MLAYSKFGTGIPLIFVHAFPLSKKMWETHQTQFSRNFQVILIDMPGFGESPLQLEEFSLKAIAKEILSTLNNLGIKEKAIFTGVSMGGYALFELWRQAAERFRAMVLTSTRAFADTPEARERRFKTIELVMEKGSKVLAEKMLPNLLGKSTLEDKKDLVKQISDWVTSANPQAIRAALLAMAERIDSTPTLKEISVPTLVVSGQEDMFIPTAEMKLMAELISKAQFSVINKAGHLPNLEQPLVFNDVFLHFLKRHVL